MTLKQRAQAVINRFKEGRAALYRAEGSQVYADDEHAERLAVLRSTRNGALREIEEEAASTIEEARASIKARTGGDVTTVLSPRSWSWPTCAAPTLSMTSPPSTPQN